MRSTYLTAAITLIALVACSEPDAQSQETIRQYQFGAGDDGRYALVLREVPRPEAGPDEVLVRIRATSLNRRDYRMLNETIGQNGVDRTGNVILSDGAGDVIAVGDNVTRWSVGDRVAGTFFTDWDDGKVTPAARASARGLANGGMLSEIIVTLENALVSIPEYLSYEEAAALPCAAVTAWSGLFTTGDLQPGEYVLLEGTGGVSTFGVLFAAAAGAQPIITSSSNDKLARARELGAVGTVNYREDEQWQQTVRELTGGVGVDHVLEIGGRSTLPRALEALRMHGHMALIGSVTGDAPPIDTAVLRSRIGSISTISVGSRRDFEDMLAFMEERQMRPIIDSTFTFDQAQEAFDLMGNGSFMGKIVITM